MDEIILSLVEAVARLNERLNEQQDVARVPGKDGVDGKDGKDGRDGKDAEQLTEAQHKAILAEWLAANKPADGKDGAAGKDGRDPTAVEIQLAVDLWFELNRDSIRGADGINGLNGRDGIDGKDGKDGANGINGLRGADGKDGTGIALIEQRDEKSFWITLDDGREYQIDLPEPAKLFGGGGGLSKARADELYAPIGSGAGADGKSAYELALEDGFIGSESAWLASLVGADGAKGDTGDTGDTGATGAKGDKGDKGDTGDTGEQGIAGPKGDTGDQGPQGEQGIQGEKGDKGDDGEDAELSNTTPQALATTASAGTSADASRADHVHAKNVRAFNASGEVAATIKIWTGTVTSDGNGDFTVNYSSAGFTSPPMVTVSALSTNTDTVRDKEWATLRETPTTTSANGYTLKGRLIVSILLGGGETTADAGSVVVHVHAIGV